MGIVPARAGSKRLPGKNALLLGSMPLWMRALQQGEEAGLDQVVVSTNMPEILRMLSDSVERRPEELCQDDTPIEAVVRYVLQGHPGYDGVVVLNPTHPLRRVEDIRLCVLALEDFPSCTAVRKDYSYTIEEGVRFLSLNEQGRVPRLVVTGSTYAVRVPAFLERGKLMISGNVNRGTYHIEQGEHIDIDTMADYIQAKALWGHRHGTVQAAGEAGAGQRSEEGSGTA